MEGCATDGSPPTGVDEEKFEHVKEADSATNFQRFVYDLFEKNGILTDLRAYLRGHIVNVLKSAQTGELLLLYSLLKVDHNKTMSV